MNLPGKVLISVGLIVLSLLSSAGLFPPVRASITCSSSASPSWQICGPVEAYAGFDLQPAILSALDGSLSLAWMANHDPSGGLTSNFNILYATRLANGTWLQTSTITTKGGTNQMPTLAQTSDGTIYLFWSYQSTTSTHSQIYYRTLKGGTWSMYTQATNTIRMNDTYPSAAVGKDGTIWLAWTRDNDTASGSTPVFRQLVYKTLRSGVWSPDSNITSPSDINWNWQPSLVIGKDAVERLVFAKGQSSTGHYLLNYMTNNGNGWSPPSPISTCTSPCSMDVNPSIMQDRNGTLWLFWSRDIVVSTTQSTFEIYAKSSTDGINWSAETALTSVNCSTTGCIDSEYPAAVQSNTSTDQNIWVFYATDSGTTGFDIWGLKTTNPISPVHDIAITQIGLSNYPGFWYPGGFSDPYYPSVDQAANLTINVTIRNLGDLVETPMITVTVTNTTTITLAPTSIQLSAGASTVVTFNWKTVFDITKPAWYSISATISNVPGESFGNRPDNSMSILHSVHVLPPGDVDQDGSTTANDVSQIKYAYGAQPCSVPGSLYPLCTLYNPYFDISSSGTIDATAISVAIAHYGIFT